VRKTCYPGLASHPQHSFVSQQMSGFGGMVSFYIDGDAAMAERFIDLLKVFAIAPSLGGVESLATQPIYTSHHGLSAETLKQAHVDGSLVRLSVGLEDVKDLIDDLDQAFSLC
ncbi:MAG TPA: cysteine metabolism protein, partial [Methylophaga sp.]|nr:cysteine metabolism protein [Methylophaga sp.]